MRVLTITLLPSPSLVPAGLPPLSQNDALILAGTLHGIHAITGKLSPVEGAQQGVEVIENEGCKMILMLTATGGSLIFATIYIFFSMLP